MYDFPDRDAKTYDLIQRGETIGMFQIESRAQINSILHTKPDHLYDIVVQVALIRPGPIQASFVRPYTERRLGHETVVVSASRRWRACCGARRAFRSSRSRRWRSRCSSAATRRPRRTCCAARWATSGRRARLEAALRRRSRSACGRAAWIERDGDEDLPGPGELRELWISRVARVELRADRVRDGVSQGALSDGVLHRAAQRAADGVLSRVDVGARRQAAWRGGASALSRSMAVGIARPSGRRCGSAGSSCAGSATR